MFTDTRCKTQIFRINCVKYLINILICCIASLMLLKMVLFVICYVLCHRHVLISTVSLLSYEYFPQNMALLLVLGAINKCSFNCLFSKTTWVSWHQKGETILDFNEEEMMWWQWHQLDHMQIICTSLQTDFNHTSTPSLNVLQTGCSSDAQPTVSKH